MRGRKIDRRRLLPAVRCVTFLTSGSHSTPAPVTSVDGSSPESRRDSGRSVFVLDRLNGDLREAVTINPYGGWLVGGTIIDETCQASASHGGIGVTWGDRRHMWGSWIPCRPLGPDDEIGSQVSAGLERRHGRLPPQPRCPSSSCPGSPRGAEGLPQQGLPSLLRGAVTASTWARSRCPRSLPQCLLWLGIRPSDLNIRTHIHGRA